MNQNSSDHTYTGLAYQSCICISIVTTRSTQIQVTTAEEATRPPVQGEENTSATEQLTRHHTTTGLATLQDGEHHTLARCPVTMLT